MPRKARKHAESGIYHVMLRGIDRQLMFEDQEDYFHFLEILQQCHQLSCFKLFAYCLMSNHVHLLLQVQEEGLETIIKRIGGRYVYYYNVKYQRVGHLFQDRFKSEPVEDDAYFLTVLRYIHQNPVKAKLCAAPGDYPYSSYIEYLHKSSTVDTDMALNMLSKDAFINYHKQVNADSCLEINTAKRCAVTDEQARAIIEKYSRCHTVVAFQSLDVSKKERYIKKIHEKGVSIRQLSRLTGTPKGIIERTVKM